MSTAPIPADHHLPILYPPHHPDQHDGSLGELMRALAAINARLLAEAQLAQPSDPATQHAA